MKHQTIKVLLPLQWRQCSRTTMTPLKFFIVTSICYKWEIKQNEFGRSNFNHKRLKRCSILLPYDVLQICLVRCINFNFILIYKFHETTITPTIYNICVWPFTQTFHQIVAKNQLWDFRDNNLNYILQQCNNDLWSLT